MSPQMPTTSSSSRELAMTTTTALVTETRMVDASSRAIVTSDDREMEIIDPTSESNGITEYDEGYQHSSLVKKSPNNTDEMSLKNWLAILLPCVFLYLCYPASLVYRRDFQHIRVHSRPNKISDLTLRNVLNHGQQHQVHLAMAPAFFGFFAYFGALQAWEEEKLLRDRLDSFAGASAGAMAAVLLAARVSPSQALDLCRSIRISEFSDWTVPLLALAAFKGDKFETIMFKFLHSHLKHTHSMRLEDPANHKVAVTAYDMQTWSTRILSKGGMARAARASATFPFLFQPVVWAKEDSDAGDDRFRDYLLVDGGLGDEAGLMGLSETIQDDDPSIPTLKTVINLSVGGFGTFSWKSLPTIPESLLGRGIDRVIFVSLYNLPAPGPFPSYMSSLNMANGPLAAEAARAAMAASMDAGLEEIGGKDGLKRYVLHIDAGKLLQQR